MIAASRILDSVTPAKLASFALILVLAAWAPSTPAQSESTPDVHKIAKAVDDKYNHLRSLEADFSETYHGLGIDRTESGVLWLKKPGKMRWEYRSPTEKLFISDGKDAWFYVPADRQVRKTSVKKLEDLRSPLAFLLGKTRLEKELDGLALAPEVPAAKSDVVLRGVPKAMAERVSQVKLEIDANSLIRRIIVEEVDGAVTEYRFSNLKENVQVPDDRFQFSPPAGSEVIEGEFSP